MLEHLPAVEDPEAALARVLAEVRQNVDRVSAAQHELDRQQVTGYSGNGEVSARMLGSGQLVEVTIDPELPRRYGLEGVGALVVEAVNDGMRRVQQASSATYARLAAGAGGPG